MKSILGKAILIGKRADISTQTKRFILPFHFFSLVTRSEDGFFFILRNWQDSLIWWTEHGECENPQRSKA